MIDWRQWGHEPLLLAALVLTGFVAQGAVRAERDRALVWAAVAVGYLAAGPPWEQVGRYYLFSVQMAEQLMLVYGVAPLLVAGFSAGMGAPERNRGPGRLGRKLGFGSLRSLVCGSIFILGTAFFYLPRVHGRLLLSEARLSAEHAAFLLAGACFWWPVLSRSPRWPALRYGPRLIYLLIIQVALAGVFSYLLMAEHPIYAAYEAAPRLWSKLTAEEDQVLAGVLLSGTGSLVLVTALGAAFFAWAREDESAQRASDGHQR